MHSVFWEPETLRWANTGMEPFEVIRGFRIYTYLPMCTHAVLVRAIYSSLFCCLQGRRAVCICKDYNWVKTQTGDTFIRCSIQTAPRCADVLLSTHSWSTCWHVSVNFQGWGILKILNNSTVLNFNRSRRYNSVAVKYDCIGARVIDSNHVIGKAGLSYDPIKPAGLTTHSVQHDGVELCFPARQGVFIVP